ncbi:MAG: hypothetical protein ACREDR_43300, partial [Blastocatellia bacterium]
METEAEELNSRINRIRLEMYESQTRAEQLRGSQEEGSIELARLESECQRLATEVARALEHQTAVRGRSDELETQLSVVRTSVSSAREQRAHIEIEQARLQSEADHLARMCVTELAVLLQDVVATVEAELADQGTATGLLDQPSDYQAEELVCESEQEVVKTEGDAEPADGIVENQAGEDAAGDDLAVESQTSGGPATNERAEVSGNRGPSEFDVETARTRLDEIRAKLDEMGSVNMMALEELEEADRRFTFLSSQRADILASIKGTEDALTEIKRRSRDRFRHAFTHINDNFQKMFIELFGGGRGEMILIDEEDVLESGIDLIAQPPGKRLQNVLLLSGGEKAMAALALVLAIFQYRPSPFCILDEVDA